MQWEEERDSWGFTVQLPPSGILLPILQMIGGKCLVQIRTAKVTIPHPMTEDVEDFTIQDRLDITESGITRWKILAWAEGPLLASTKCMAKGGCIITLITLWVAILRH